MGFNGNLPEGKTKVRSSVKRFKFPSPFLKAIV
jgi:hypothetical protein